MTYFKNIKALFLFLMFAAVIVSCNKENIDIDEKTEGEIELIDKTEENPLLTRSTSSETGLNLDCFTVLYSFSLIDSTGATYEITSIDDFDALANSGVFAIDFVYPVTIEFEDGETQEITSAQELGEAFANCYPNEWSLDQFPAYLIDDCYSFAYPVVLVDQDGDVTTTNNEEEFIEAISEEVQFFSYPLTLIGSDGEVVAENMDDLFVILFDCNDIVDSTWTFSSTYACYDLQFPLDLLINDGTTETAEDISEYYDLLFQGDVLGFGYPLTLIGEDNMEIVINSDQELSEAIFECEGTYTFDLISLYSAAMIPDSLTGVTCFNINFPLDVNEINPENGAIVNTITLNSMADFELLDGFDQGWVFQLPVYPFSVTSNSSGEVMEIGSFQDLLGVIVECN